MASDSAMAISENKDKGCLDDKIFKSNFLPRFVFVDRNNSPVNVRKEPTVNAAVIYAAPAGGRVFPQKQIMGTDGYCWLQVTVPSRDAKPDGFFSGWVRGDLVVIRFGS
ncbi:SH3 domain-containing protein [Leptolyngbya sp. 'hensonii']|uniref:SH3 domain-containing protein n=1 Tax=Leptolyngbya sp. 'hensonii' TaxID=1922337 RepID=UPI00117D64FE|nr:SH3 domain-containing protein [Leptolyngbya sp. 'hensonii']